MSKNHLVASKGKMSAEVYAHAIAKLQAAPAKKANPAVRETAKATAVGTEHTNYGKAPVRKEIDKHYDKPAMRKAVDTRSSKQRRIDASERYS